MVDRKKTQFIGERMLVLLAVVFIDIAAVAVECLFVASRTSSGYNWSRAFGVITVCPSENLFADIAPPL
jgi:hypothetical protein